MAKKRIVILGGGFGGVYAARHLRKQADAGVEIELINETNYFVFQPLLPEVAGGIISAADAVAPLRVLLPGVQIRQAEIHSIDRTAHAFAEITVAAVPKLNRLERAGGRSRRHGRPAECAGFQSNVDFDGGIAAAIEYFAAMNIDDGGHGGAFSGIAKNRGGQEPPTRPAYTASRARSSTLLRAGGLP